MDIERTLEEYLVFLELELKQTLENQKLSKDAKNPIIKKLADKKRATLEYQKQLQLIEMNHYFNHCH